MATEPSLQGIEPPLQPAERPTAFFRRMTVAAAGWFLVWPLVLFASLHLMTPGDTLEACLFGAGSLLWFLSCCWIYGALFAMAEARWPAATTIRKVLNFVFGILRALQGHHSS